MADPGYDAKLHEDDADGDACRCFYVCDQIRERVADAAEHCHYSANKSARPGMAATSQSAIVGQSFGESHADACADAGGESDQKGLPTVVRGEGGGEQWRERGYGAVHQAGQAGL